MSSLTTQQKSQIDRLWTEFWTGGITNPLTVIEQISFLMFARMLDVMETTNERKAIRTKKPFKRIFAQDEQHLRWSHFKVLPATVLDADLKQGRKGMLQVVRDEVFAHFRKLNGGTTFGEYMQDAQLMIQKPSLLVSAVNMIDALPITEGDAKGDLYEYLLSKLTTAGINGQFRTPRHVIRFMVELLDPQPNEVVGDPSCGTAGFLVAVMQYLLEKHTSAKAIMKGENGEPIYTGDLLEPYRAHIQNEMFHGFDFDSTMLRIASMNLMLHGVDNPDIHYQDTLSNSFPEKFPKHASGSFQVILANPPFKGSLDEGDVHPSLTSKVKTKKTELLFVALYAGVSTAILVFIKGGKTDHVFFYDVDHDGFSLDDKRDPVKENDLPDALARWKKRSAKKDTDRTAKHFMVPVKEIEQKGYDLSINRYKEAKHVEVTHAPPKEIIAKLRKLEAEIARDLDELEAML